MHPCRSHRPARALEQPRKLVLALPLPRGSLAVAAGGVTVQRSCSSPSRGYCGAGAARAPVGRRRPQGDAALEWSDTRSFLVDVHLLGR